MIAVAADIDPWGAASIDDYEHLFSAFGIKPFTPFRDRFAGNRYVRRGLIFGHRDFDKIVDAIDENTPWAMMTGLMPSGRFHFGHKMVADEIIWFQRLGGEIFVCAADMESWLMRDISFAEGRRIAVEEYLTNYIALGLEPDKKFHFWFQSDYMTPYYRLRDMASKRVTFNEMQAIYGELSPGKITSVLTQVADILHPQLPEKGGPKPVVVPVGADQDPHIRLTRDIASRLAATREDGNQDFPCLPPAGTYHKFMRGLTGDKMSSSDPATHIALLEDPDEAAKKVMRAKTGGRDTVEEQREKGGTPEDCVVYDLYVYHLIDDDKELTGVYRECTGGERVCGDCKRQCADLVKAFLADHQKNIPAARKKAEKILKDAL